MITLDEIIILWYSSLHEFHMVCVQFSDDAIYKSNGTKQLAGRIQTFECKNAKSGVKCCNHWEKVIHQTNHVDNIRAPGTLSDNVTPYIDYFTYGPVVQCNVPVVKRCFCRLLHINDKNWWIINPNDCT